MFWGSSRTFSEVMWIAGIAAMIVSTVCLVTRHRSECIEQINARAALALGVQQMSNNTSCIFLGGTVIERNMCPAIPRDDQQSVMVDVVFTRKTTQNIDDGKHCPGVSVVGCM